MNYKVKIMKAGIHYKEIYQIVNELRNNEGYISKEEFQQKIEQLNEIEIVRRKQTPLVNNKSEIIHAITKYQNNAKLKGFESSYKKFIKGHLTKLGFKNLSFNEVQLDLRASFYSFPVNWDTFENHELVQYNFVSTLNELTKILGVTRPTINRWEKLNMKAKNRVYARLIVSGQIFYPFHYDHIIYYDLGCIRQELSDLT